MFDAFIFVGLIPGKGAQVSALAQMIVRMDSDDPDLTSEDQVRLTSAERPVHQQLNQAPRSYRGKR